MEKEKINIKSIQAEKASTDAQSFRNKRLALFVYFQGWSSAREGAYHSKKPRGLSSIAERVLRSCFWWRYRNWRNTMTQYIYPQKPSRVWECGVRRRRVECCDFRCVSHKWQWRRNVRNNDVTDRRQNRKFLLWYYLEYFFCSLPSCQFWLYAAELSFRVFRLISRQRIISAARTVRMMTCWSWRIPMTWPTIVRTVIILFRLHDSLKYGERDHVHRLQYPMSSRS